MPSRVKWCWTHTGTSRPTDQKRPRRANGVLTTPKARLPSHAPPLLGLGPVRSEWHFQEHERQNDARISSHGHHSLGRLGDRPRRSLVASRFRRSSRTRPIISSSGWPCVPTATQSATGRVSRIATAGCKVRNFPSSRQGSCPGPRLRRQLPDFPRSQVQNRLQNTSKPASGRTESNRRRPCRNTASTTRMRLPWSNI